MSTPNNRESWREKLRRAVKESRDRLAGLSEEQAAAVFEQELDRFTEQLSTLFVQALSAEAMGDAPGEEMFAQAFEDINGQQVAAQVAAELQELRASPGGGILGYPHPITPPEKDSK